MTDKDTIATRFDWLDKGLAEGRVLRKRWKSGDKRPGNGYERACLLVMVAPEVGDAGDVVAACPTWLLPPWFASLVPWMDDSGTESEWPIMVQGHVPERGTHRQCSYTVFEPVPLV